MATTQLRFDSEKLKKSIQKLAKQNGRSMNAEINKAIHNHISVHEKWEANKQSNKK
jgi:predicted transcriptional regulator